MSSGKKYSLFIRLVSGVLGVGGIAAIPYNAARAGGITPGFMLFASLFAGFVFLYAAFFGCLPWESTKDNEDGED